MTNAISLDKRYSTTRLLTQEKPEIVNNSEDKVQIVLSLPKSEERKGEGGLRTQGYFKKSYKAKPLITVITVVFNGEKYLEETIQSVLNQTYDNVEYIIIDGGSTDSTLDILKKYDDKIDYWVSEKDSGIYDAWNKGVVTSLGDWISFLGSDDIFMNDAVASYVDKILKNPFIEYISSNVLLCDDNKQAIRTIGTKWNWKDFSKFMNVAHVGSMHNRSFFNKYGLYDLDFKICGDYELLLRAKQKLQSDYIQVTTCCMRVGGISDNNYQVFKETYLAKLKYHSRMFDLLAKLDMFVAILKWKIRKKIWY